MTPLFQYELLNQPFGDPALYVRLAGEKKALLFDAGDISRVRAGKLLKVSDVFVSHMHIDHFIGLDHLIRLNLAREKTITVFGPAGIIRNVRGKLSGYTWNLVNEYAFYVEAVEIGASELKRVRFLCREEFRAGHTEKISYTDSIEAHPHYSVHALRLDHGTASMAYALRERFHININRDRLLALGLPVGKWLRELKEAIWQDKPDSWVVPIVPERGPAGIVREATLGELKRDIVTVTSGQKAVYVADCRGTERNMQKIVSFAAGADILFCEAAFLEKDREKAAERGHLTAGQAGSIARLAGVKELRVFHFSPRYECCPDLLYEEAEKAFRCGTPDTFRDEG